MVGLEMLVAAEEEALDSNSQAQVVQAMLQGLPSKTGAAHKDRISSSKGENLSEHSFV